MLILYALLKAVINLSIKFILSLQSGRRGPFRVRYGNVFMLIIVVHFWANFMRWLLLTHTLAGLKSILPLIQLHNSHNKLSENCSVVKVFQWSW